MVFGIPTQFYNDKNDFLDCIRDNVDNTLSETTEVLKKFDLEFSEDDIQVVKYVCEVVSIRAAMLISTCK